MYICSVIACMYVCGGVRVHILHVELQAGVRASIRVRSTARVALLVSRAPSRTIVIKQKGTLLLFLHSPVWNLNPSDGDLLVFPSEPHCLIALTEFELPHCFSFCKITHSPFPKLFFRPPYLDGGQLTHEG